MGECLTCGATPRGLGYRDGSQGRPHVNPYVAITGKGFDASMYTEGYHAGLVARQTMANLGPSHGHT